MSQICLMTDTNMTFIDHDIVYLVYFVYSVYFE